MAAYTGLSHRLKDKETSVADKLKLTKFAWVSEAVHIPNKHQFLLDFASGLVVNRKKHSLTEADSIQVWKTLAQLLVGASDSQVQVKPSILQALNDSLCTPKSSTKLEVVSNLHNKQRLAHVLHCALLVVKAPSGEAALPFDGLLQLLSNVLHIWSSKDVRYEDPSLGRNISDLVGSILPLLVKGQSSHHNHSHVMQLVTDKLLEVSLVTLDEIDNPSLTEFLVSCLLPEENMGTYCTYLDHVTATTDLPGGKPLPKSVATVFSVCDKLVKKGHTSVAEKFFPCLIHHFVKLNSSRSQSCFLLLKHVISTLDPLKDAKQTVSKKSVLPRKRNAQSSESWSKAVSLCVGACVGSDFLEDPRSKGDNLKWFCQLTETMLDHPRDAAWFLYMQSVQEMNHLVVEKHFVQILLRGLIQTDEISQDTRDPQDRFLAGLVSVYVKLRNTSALVTALLEASALAKENNSLRVMSSLGQFKNSLCEMFQEVPSTTLLDLWEKVRQHTTQLLSLAVPAVPSLEWALMVYTLLLSHARLFEHRVAGVVQDKAEHLANQLHVEVLAPLYKNKELSAKCNTSLQELTSAWSLAQYLLSPAWRGSHKGDHGGTDSHRHSLKMVKKADFHTQVCLSAHRRDEKFVSADKEMSAIVNNFLQFLSSMPVFSEDVVFHIWGEDSQPATPTEHAVSQFHQFCRLFPLVGHLMSQNQLRQCAEVIVEVMTFDPKERGTESEDLLEGCTSLFAEVKEFLSHAATQECRTLQGELCATVWGKIFSREGQDVAHSPKKKKKKRADTTDSDTRQKVCDFISTSASTEGSCHVCLEDWALEQQTFSSPHLLEVLVYIPVEYLPDVNLKCQIGCLCLLASVKQGDPQLRSQIEGHLMRCLSVANLTGLFACLAPSDLIHWAMGHCAQGGDSKQTLLSTCVEAVMKDRTAMLTVVPFSKELVQRLKEDKEQDSIKMWTVALLVRNTQRYMSFHIPEVKDAALEIYFCLAKCLIKHGLTWLDTVTAPSSVSESKIERKKRKRKSEEVTLTTANSSPVAWQAVLTALAEVVSMWSHSVVKTTVNQHLVTVCRQLLARVITRVKAGQSQEPDLKFITACCHCHMRCSSLPSPPSEGEQDCESENEASPFKFVLLTAEDLKQLWSELFTQAPLVFADKLSSRSEDSGGQKEEESSVFDQMAQWPVLCTSWVDGLVAVVESSDPMLFSSLLQTMLDVLSQGPMSSSKTDTGRVLVTVALWRRLVTSHSLHQAYVQVWFKHSYQFLSAFLSLLLQNEATKVANPPHHGEVGETQHALTPAFLSRFLLEAIADFLDLGKTQVSARLALLCMQSAVTFTLTCPDDLLALHRLTNTLLVLHTNASLTAVPSVLYIINKCLRSCLQWGMEEDLQQHSSPTHRLGQVLRTAQLLTRLLVLLTTPAFKQDLSKVAHNILGEYLLTLQRGTLNTAVKSQILRGLFKLMNVSDKYRLASLHMTLPPGVKDTFKLLHQEYRKYHQWSGRA